MRVHLVGLAVLAVAMFALALPITATQQPSSANLNDLSMEISALETLHDLDLTPYHETDPKMIDKMTFSKENANGKSDDGKAQEDAGV